MGPFLCDFWTSSDVLCCTASILHLLAIALDRSATSTPHIYICYSLNRPIQSISRDVRLFVWRLSVGDRNQEDWRLMVEGRIAKIAGIDKTKKQGDVIFCFRLNQNR